MCTLVIMWCISHNRSIMLGTLCSTKRAELILIDSELQGFVSVRGKKQPPEVHFPSFQRTTVRRAELPGGRRELAGRPDGESGNETFLTPLFSGVSCLNQGRKRVQGSLFNYDRPNLACQETNNPCCPPGQIGLAALLCTSSGKQC